MENQTGFKRIPSSFSGWYFLRAIAYKVGKSNPRDVTPKDIHNFGHLENTFVGSGEVIPPVFEEQIDMETAQAIVDEPNKTWEGR